MKGRRDEGMMSESPQKAEAQTSERALHPGQALAVGNTNIRKEHEPSAYLLMA
jgi:hypothetical protein